MHPEFTNHFGKRLLRKKKEKKKTCLKIRSKKGKRKQLSNWGRWGRNKMGKIKSEKKKAAF